MCPGTLHTQAQDWSRKDRGEFTFCLALSTELPTPLQGAQCSPSLGDVATALAPWPLGHGSSAGCVARPGGQASMQSGFWPGGHGRSILVGVGGGRMEAGSWQPGSPNTQQGQGPQEKQVRVCGGQAVPGWCLQEELPLCADLLSPAAVAPGQGSGPPQEPPETSQFAAKAPRRGTERVAVGPSCGGGQSG